MNLLKKIVFYIFYNFSEYKETYLNKPKEITQAENLGTAYVGPVTETAQVKCEAGFIATLDDRRRFNTTYQIK